MEFRLARIEDLKQLKIIYKEIIKNMNKNNIQIWDDIYPCEFFDDDINNKCLYVIANDEEIIAAFALCDNNAGEAYVEWSEKSAKAKQRKDGKDPMQLARILQKEKILAIKSNYAKCIGKPLPDNPYL